MANVLKMAIVQSIQQLHAAGWSQRRIARELEIDRGTVARHVRPPRPDPNTAISPAGSGVSNAATFPPLPAPVPGIGNGNGCADLAAVSNPSRPPLRGGARPAGSGGENPHAAHARRGRPAECEPYRPLILTLLDQQLSAQRIWQDLVAEYGFTGSYDSVKRFVRRLGAGMPLPFRRLECGPGEEAQVDFGTGAPVITPEGRRRKTYVFRIVLNRQAALR